MKSEIEKLCVQCGIPLLIKSVPIGDNKTPYCLVRWDAVGRKTGKPYRGCSSLLTSVKRVREIVELKKSLNPSVELDHCAMFL